MLVGFAGCKGSGKDTAAGFLLEQGDWTKIAFADQLKRAVAALFDIPLEDVNPWMRDDQAVVVIDWSRGQKILTSREFIQRFGTEMGRNVFGPNFWVDQWWTQYLAEPDLVVVPDVRFTNEALRIKELGGYIIEIIRPGHEPDGHASERGLPTGLIDMRLYNDGSLEDLRVRTFAALQACEAGVTNAT